MSVVQHKIINFLKTSSFICRDIIKKNTNLYKTTKNNLLKLNVSGEILPLSIVNFVEFEKKEKSKNVIFGWFY